MVSCTRGARGRAISRIFLVKAGLRSLSCCVAGRCAERVLQDCASCGAGWDRKDCTGKEAVAATGELTWFSDAGPLAGHSLGNESGKDTSIDDKDVEDCENTGSVGVGGMEKSVSMGLVGSWLSRGSPGVKEGWWWW